MGEGEHVKRKTVKTGRPSRRNQEEIHKSIVLMWDFNIALLVIAGKVNKSVGYNVF